MILVVGATGDLGTAICRRQRDKGLPACGVVRTTSDPIKVSYLQNLGVETVQGNLKDRAALDVARKGAETVITTATITRSRQPDDTIQNVDQAGQINLVEAAQAAGARLFFSGVLLIMAVGLALRVWNLGEASLWTDEALTALRAQASFQESFASLQAAANQTPIYYWSLRLLPTTTDTLLRLPSALLGLAGIGLAIYVITIFYEDRELALWVGALLAVNPYHVWLSRTARPYTMIFVLSLLITYFFLQLLRGRRSRATWIGLAITSMIAYATHFTAVGLFAAQFGVFALAARQKPGFVRRWMALQLLAGLPALGWMYFVTREPVKVASVWIPRPELRDVPLTLWNMTLGYDGIFKWEMVPGLLIVTVGLVFGMGLATGERKQRPLNFTWVMIIAATLIPVYVMSRLVVSIYLDRYFMVALPALMLIMIRGWQQYSPVIWRAALTVVGLTGTYTVLFSFYDGSYERQDWRLAAEYVADGFQPGDMILLDRHFSRTAFSRYYFVSDENVETAALLTTDPEAPLVLLENTPDTTALEKRSNRVWVVYRNPNEDAHRLGLMPDFDPFDPALSDMGAWLSARHDLVIDHRSFNGVRVLLLDTRRPMAIEP